MKKYILQIKQYIGLEILMDIICTICLAFAPVLQQQLFDHIANGSLRTILIIVFVYLFLQLGNVIAGYLCMIFTWKGAIRFEKSLKRDFFRTVFKMEKSDFYQKPIGEYVSLQGNDITALEQDYLQPATDIVRSANMLLIYGTVLFVFVDWRIAIVIVATSLFAAFGPKLTGKKMAAKRNIYQKQMAAYVTKITDLLEGFKVINSLTRAKINEQHEHALEETAEKRYAFGKAKTLSLSVNELNLKIIQIASFAAAGILLIRGEITIGTGVATFGYVSSFIDPIDSILYDVNAIQSVKDIKEKFLAYVKEEASEEKEKPVKLKDSIVFENVEYQNGDFSLNGINMRLEQGKKYALIGPSGSGKSTLLKLLMGYITPHEGRILIDGKTSEKLDMSGLISYVDQNEHIYRAGYTDNVTVFGAYSEEKPQRAERYFNKKIMETLHKREQDGNCQELSGGEKQTLNFLRMLAKDSSVILLDEPFAAVDVHTKADLENFLFESGEMKQKTIVIVTHDVSEQALARYDKVFQLRNGELEC